jgi:hypothetical protein
LSPVNTFSSVTWVTPKMFFSSVSRTIPDSGKPRVTQKSRDGIATGSHLGQTVPSGTTAVVAFQKEKAPETIDFRGLLCPLVSPRWLRAGDPAADDWPARIALAPDSARPIDTITGIHGLAGRVSGIGASDCDLLAKRCRVPVRQTRCLILPASPAC